MGYSLMNPAYGCGGERYELKGADGGWEDARVRAEIRAEEVQAGRTRLTVRFLNRTEGELRIQPEIRACSDFRFEKYLIPAVSVNGNRWGRGLEPKGLKCDGEAWVFDYRRTAIPSCTLSENGESYLALMASNRDETSLRSSCAMEERADGRMIHRLLWPEIERPKTYCYRDRYAEAHEEWIDLGAGEAFEAEAWILTGAPRARNFAAADVQDAAMDILGGELTPKYRPEEIEELACDFAKSLLMDVNGRKLFSIGWLRGGDGVCRQGSGNEFGWCGQNGLYARLMLERGLETGDEELIGTGCGVLDAFSMEAVGKTGLIHTHYDWMIRGTNDVEDTCNQGYAIGEMAKAWQLAEKYGMKKDHWLQAARGAADFLLTHYSEEWGFGKAWNVETGECADLQGSIGAYVIPGLTALYRATGEERYLHAARKAMRLYRDRDLLRFECTAGALDTYCIDREGSGPMLTGSVELYDIDGEDEWLECAKLAGWYFCSWMFHHDTVSVPDSDFAVYGYRALGGTSVSAQHHHIDLWGVQMAPEMLRLWQLTGDMHWRRRALLMWANSIQNIAPKEGKAVHGYMRGPGAQNEAYFHCCCGDPVAPGGMNEWMVAWPQAFAWRTAREAGGLISEITENG